MPTELDPFDHQILRHLAANGRMRITELASHIGLSKTPCQARVKRLETSGYILGYHAALSAEKLGLSHIAFVQITLNNTRETALEAFNTAVRQIPEIEQCHMIAGGFDYLLKVRTPSIEAYRKIMGEQISTLPHVKSSSTFVSMEAVKESTSLTPKSGA
ncbi:MAG: winged helix-turn-helix transcriptional regulator [Rhodobacteraceae bacterium]|nr:winged helix-turn-helix transcriptional regulator [Paracoccaceae bacterium]